MFSLGDLSQDSIDFAERQLDWGECLGKYSTLAPRASIVSSTPATLRSCQSAQAEVAGTRLLSATVALCRDLAGYDRYPIRQTARSHALMLLKSLETTLRPATIDDPQSTRNRIV
jgi:hypothetical protein